MRESAFTTEVECEECGHSQKVTVVLINVDTWGKDPDQFISGLVEEAKQEILKETTVTVAPVTEQKV